MIHMIETAYASPMLRKLMTSDRTIQEDELMLALFNGVPDNHTFVDHYGPLSTLAQIGMSWWRDVVPQLDLEFVLSPNECDVFAKKVMENLPPAPAKVIQAMGEGTELAYCVEQYPNSDVVRDPSLPYNTIEQSALFYKLGLLVGILHNGASESGIVVSP